MGHLPNSLLLFEDFHSYAVIKIFVVLVIGASLSIVKHCDCETWPTCLAAGYPQHHGAEVRGLLDPVPALLRHRHLRLRGHRHRAAAGEPDADPRGHEGISA